MGDGRWAIDERRSVPLLRIRKRTGHVEALSMLGNRDLGSYVVGTTGVRGQVEGLGQLAQVGRGEFDRQGRQ
jgi:hypothetical protein